MLSNLIVNTCLQLKCCRLAGSISCGDPESFVTEGPLLKTFLFSFVLVYEGKRYSNVIISGPLSARQRTPFNWRFAGVPMMVLH